jgi:GH15 family glucan-1,4-alpha-glucosidase
VADADGWLVIRDALLVGPWYDDSQRAVEYQRPPGDHEAEQVLLRTIRCVNGHVDLLMDCEPSPDYARAEVAGEYESEGYSHALTRIAPGDLPLRLTSDLRMGFEGRRAHATTTMQDGDERFVALSSSDHEPPPNYQDAADRMWRTQEYWRGWLNQGEFPDHPWRIHLQRSALTLKGLTYAPTGALMAAGTTSLPETPGGERNWDYRYSWIRDSTFALWGLYTLGFDSEADGFFEFVADRVEAGSDLQVMYGFGGERDLTETILPHLSGYEDAQPVRIGNGAFDQDQHDVWGALLDSIYLNAKSRDRITEQDDDRIRATVLAIADELTVDGLVLRYRVEQTDDGLSGEEGTFTICSFWLVSALVEIGELRRARELCEKLLSFASPLQLYVEEIDAITGRHLGNFPQAFTHLAQINALVHLIQAELREKRGFSMAHQIVT